MKSEIVIWLVVEHAKTTTRDEIERHVDDLLDNGVLQDCVFDDMDGFKDSISTTCIVGDVDQTEGDATARREERLRVATACLQGLITRRTDGVDRDMFAEHALQMADALIAAVGGDGKKS